MTLIKKETGGIKHGGNYLSFPEISQYVAYWAERDGLELRDIRLHDDPSVGDYSSPKTNECVKGGIAFRLFVGGRPASEKMACSLCNAASLADGTAFSMSQARQVFGSFLWEKSAQLWAELQATTIDADA